MSFFEPKRDFKSILTGLLSGVINGFFGGGGGLVIVPMLKRYSGMDSKNAHATAIAITTMMNLATIAVYIKTKSVSVNEALYFMLGGCAGGFAGAVLLNKISKTALRKLFAAFLIFCALRMIVYG